MVFKINISEKSGKTFKLESESESLIGKELYDKISGDDISGDLHGYEFEIRGFSDKAGFPAMKEIEGIGLSKMLLGYGKGMRRRPKKEGKIKRSDIKPKGLRLRKTVRGKIISEDIVQINLKLIKEGNKKLSEIFPDQNKAPEVEKPKEEAKPLTAEKVVEKTPEKQVEKPIEQNTQ